MPDMPLCNDSSCFDRPRRALTGIGNRLEELVRTVLPYISLKVLRLDLPGKLSHFVCGL
jgi:hypothetical protein